MSRPDLTQAHVPSKTLRRLVAIPPATLQGARARFVEGDTREAFDLLQSCGDLKDVSGTDARLVAGDIVRAMGAPRLARNLHFRAWRGARHSPQARVAGLNALFETGGVHAVWRRLQQMDCTTGVQGDGASNLELNLLRAKVSASFHEFDSAEMWWRKAEKLGPKDPALYLTLCAMLERETRYEDGLAAARKAIELGPRAGGGYRAAAHLLQVLRRDEESSQTLEQGRRNCQSVPILCELALLQDAMGRHAQAEETLDAIFSLSPIVEKGLVTWLLGLRYRAAWQGGKVAAAIAAARQQGTPYALKFAERLEAPGAPPRRVQYSVPFVRQDRDTCSPATLAALSEFWQRPAEHLEVADEICYLGTPAHAGRTWAEKHGWHAREFTITWDIARHLLDRGVPFVMYTFSADSGHAQAVVGYDEAQATLIVRDSNCHHLIEYDAQTLFEQQRLSGPAALLILPPDRASVLDGLQLPEAGVRDSIHQFHLALGGHRRDEAVRILADIRSQAPSHSLALATELELAYYDGNTPQAVQCLEGLLEKQPENERLLMQKLACLNAQTQRDKRLELLSEACRRPNSSPSLLISYTEELRQDARELDLAASHARRALRRGSGAAVSSLASILWSRREFPKALELYRFAACQNDKDENAARQYFAAARHLKQEEQALDFLKKRFERYSRRSPYPAISLCQAMINSGRRHEVEGVLAAARNQRPADGELLLLAAQIKSAAGRTAEADALLRGAEGKVAAPKVSRQRAYLASRERDLGPAIALWREILEREPLALDAHRELAQALAEKEGRLIALKHLEQACKANPNHFGLHNLLFSWLGSEGPRALEPVLNRLVELNPVNAGMRFERARCLARMGRWHTALSEADLAVELEPSHPTGHAWRGWILKTLGRKQEAVEAYRRAIHASVDYDHSIMEGLISCGTTVMDRRLSLNFLQTELSSHLIYGNGLLAFREVAAHELHAEEVLKILQNVLAERPDLWHAWAAVIRQFAAQGQFDEAVKVAESAKAKLPLCAELWIEIAALHQRRRDTKAELAARQTALELSPGNVEAMRRLAGAFQRAEQPERAKEVLEEALRIRPRDAATLVFIAWLHWTAERKDQAIGCVREAISYDPYYSAAWDRLESWGQASGQPRLAFETAQKLAQERKDDPGSWLRLARFHWHHEDVAAALEAAEKAISLRPADVDAQTLKVQILAAEERFEEALAVCKQDVWGAVPPPELRCTAACILHDQGKRDEAAPKMEEALADGPNLVWAWERLADWHLAERRETEARAVMEKFSSLFPNSTMPLLRTAADYQRLKNYPEATDLLEKALQMDPECVEARRRIMIIQVLTNQFAAVRDTIAALRQYGLSDWALAAEGCAALKQGDAGFACSRLFELCTMPGLRRGALQWLADSFLHTGHGATMCEPLERALESSDVAPEAGWLWIEARRIRGNLPGLGQVLKLKDRGAMFRMAAIQYLRSLAYSASNSTPMQHGLSSLTKAVQVSKLRKSFSALLSNDTEAWIEFGRILAGYGRRGAARNWIKDWRSRKKVRTHLFAMSKLLGELNLDSDLLEIGQEALRQSPADDRLPLLVRLAWLEANRGDTKTAATHVARFQSVSSLAPICSVLRWVIRVRDAKPEDRARESADAFNSIRVSLHRKYLAGSPAFVRRYTRETAALLASNGAGSKARRWASINCRPVLRLFPRKVKGNG